MEIPSEFLEKIITAEDLALVLDEINLAGKMIFQKVELLLSEKIKNKVSENFQKFIENLEKKGVISKDPEKNEIFFLNLKEYLKKIPQIKIELAFIPKREFIEKLSLFFKREIGEKIFLDIIYKPEIVAGVILEYKGKYLDLSLAKKIDEILKTHE